MPAVPDVAIDPDPRARADARPSAGAGGGEDLASKERTLRDMMAGYGSVIVAFSGGVDSALVAAVASQVLGNDAIAVTADSPSLARSELADAIRQASQIGVAHRTVRTGELDRVGYRRNGPDRCFFCKDTLYALLLQMAADEGYATVANGTNVDDFADHRPGMSAASKYGVRSPLAEAGLAKDDVRALAREMGLSAWDKPAQACLSSRIPYGTPVSVEVLEQVGRAEAALRKLGLGQVRVRHHGRVARIEVPPGEIPALAEPAMAARVSAAIKAAGYAYAALDLDGFRSGSMNEALATDSVGETGEAVATDSNGKRK